MILEINEDSIRKDIYLNENRIGRVNINYPVFPEELKKINSFFTRFKDAYILYAEKRIPKLYSQNESFSTCSMTYRTVLCDEKNAVFHFEVRIYSGNERIYSSGFDMSWDIIHGILQSKKRMLGRPKKKKEKKSKEKKEKIV